MERLAQALLYCGAIHHLYEGAHAVLKCKLGSRGDGELRTIGELTFAHCVELAFEGLEVDDLAEGVAQ